MATMEDETGSRPEEDGPKLERARIAEAVRMGRALAGPYSAPGWLREGCYVLAGLTVLLGPQSPYTFVVFGVLLVLGSVLTRRFFRRVAVLAPYGAALLDAFGRDGTALVLEEMDRSPRSSAPVEDLQSAVRNVLTRPSQSDCSGGHAVGCVHRGILRRPPALWWPADFTAVVVVARTHESAP